MERRNSSGGSSPAFLIGIIIGVLVTLLLSTKKGRKILKVMVDEGVERISKWEDVVDSLKTQVEEDVELEDEPIMGEEVVQIDVKEVEPEPEEIKEEEKVEEIKEEPPLHAAVAEESEKETKVKEKSEEEKPKKKSRFFKRSTKKSA